MHDFLVPNCDRRPVIMKDEFVHSAKNCHRRHETHKGGIDYNGLKFPKLLESVMDVCDLCPLRSCLSTYSIW